MAKYSFVTNWTFDAPLETVWKEIRNMDAWPEWWKYVKSVELIKIGDMNDIGSVRRITWTTALPYELTFDSELVSVDFQKRMEGKAFGELTGVGIWTFNEVNGKTHVRYDWIVETTKKWMNIFAPIARPLFKWNHDKVMNAGYKGLKARLNPY
jgi:uncharacterized membrane protein